MHSSIDPTAYQLLEQETSSKDAKPWDQNRAYSEMVQTFYNGTEYQKYANRINECANLIRFSDAVDKTSGEVKLKLKTAFFCKVRWCPVCTWRRSLRLKAKFYKSVPAIVKANPTHQFAFLTLTLKNVPVQDLKEGLKHLSDSFHRLTMLAKFKDAVKGYVKTVEITKQEGKEFAHHHIHCLLHVQSSYFSKKHKYITQPVWQEMWRQSARIDYAPQVNVKRIRPKGDKTSIEAAVLEVLKYSVKPSDLVESENFLLHLTKNTHRMKFISSSGTLGKIFKEQDLDTDLTDNDDAQIIEIDPFEKAYVWSEGIKKYKRAPRFDRESHT